MEERVETLVRWVNFCNYFQLNKSFNIFKIDKLNSLMELRDANLVHKLLLEMYFYKLFNAYLHF